MPSGILFLSIAREKFGARKQNLVRLCACFFPLPEPDVRIGEGHVNPWVTAVTSPQGIERFYSDRLVSELAAAAVSH